LGCEPRARPKRFEETGQDYRNPRPFISGEARKLFNFIVRRTLQMIPLLLLVSIVLFSILQEAPGGPLTPYLQNPHITQADIDRLKHNLGLDQPPPIQYLHWLGRVVHGDFGWSQSNSEPVTQAIVERLPATLELMGASFAFSLAIGVAAGIISAVRQYSWIDYLVTTFSFFGQSMPVFWFALMLQLLFAVYGIPLPGGYKIALPSAGISTSDAFDLGDRVTHLILPTIVLSLAFIAQYSRFMRSSMLEVIRTDYMRTAAAKGVSRIGVIFRHGLKNALIPLVTIVALTLPGLVAGAVITETIFAWPGMGRLFITALSQFDFALLMGYMMLTSFLVIVCNLLADICYAWLDPRVKYS
jgi:peptide/nickel transport system permease protein